MQWKYFDSISKPFVILYLLYTRYFFEIFYNLAANCVQFLPKSHISGMNNNLVNIQANL